MTRLVDALDRVHRLRKPRPGSVQAREDGIGGFDAEDSPTSPPSDWVSSPARKRPRNTVGSHKPSQARVPGVPTQLDLTDDTADVDLEADSVSELAAIDLELVLPEGMRTNISGAGSRLKDQKPFTPTESRAKVRPAAPRKASSQTTDHRLPSAQDDALRLALQIRVAVNRGRNNSLIVCGVEPGQTVRRLTRELALAFVQLRESPVLIVDLEPSEAAEARYEFYPLPETDSATWISPGPQGRPSAALLCPPRRRETSRGSFVTSAQFGRNLDSWRTEAALVICCARSVPDSIATLTAGTCCGAALLVVPGTGSTLAAAVAARDLCLRAGVTLLGCAIDQTPTDFTEAHE